MIGDIERFPAVIHPVETNDLVLLIYLPGSRLYSSDAGGSSQYPMLGLQMAFVILVLKNLPLDMGHAEPTGYDERAKYPWEPLRR